MLPDSMNVSVIADNIRAIWDKIKDISGHILPETNSATAGQILKLDADKEPTWADEYSYTPPAYAETEVNTGQKWIDGKDIYMKYYNISVALASDDIDIILIDTLVKSINNVEYISGETSLKISGVQGLYTSTSYLRISYRNEDNVLQYTSGGSFIGAKLNIIIYYTKPDPTRADDPEPVDKGTGTITGEDPEPETKATRKKTSK